MINEVILLGNISQAPAMRTGTDGICRCNFSVAMNKKKKDGSQRVTFVSCIADEHISKFVERYFRLGDPIALHGELNIVSYVTTHGDKATKAFIAVDRVSFCGKGYDEVKRSGEPEASEELSEREEGMSMFDVQYDEEELPFG